MARIVDGEQLNMVGANIKKARRALKLSQQELADRLETIAVYVCRGSVSRIEKGKRTVTDIELWGFSQVLNVPVQDLFDQ